MKQNILRIVVITIALLVLTAGYNPAAAADAVVGNGTPASCTEAAFDSALLAASTGGGTITFNCGPNPATIQLSIAKLVTLSDVTIDGGDRITLNAGNNDRHFFAGPGVTFELRHLTLRDGNSLVNGGAIEASGADVILDSVHLGNNYSTVSGGAIYCYDGTLTIRDSTFENNGASTGGAIYNDGCAVTIDGSRFLANEALDTLGRGGAINNAPPGTVAMTGSLLQGNRAPDGGGLYVDSGATADLVRVTFRDNSGNHGGGLENAGTTTARDSLFEENTVTGSGGGLWNFGGQLTLRRTTVRANTAHEGGGINSYGSQLNLTDVNIINNVAEGTHGGGLYHGGGTAFVANATISGNRATDANGNGGGIYQYSDDNLTLTNVTLAENEAGFFGGGLFHYGRYAILTHVTLVDNVAGAAGDAIYDDSPMTPANPGVVQIANSVIAGSTNTFCGGLFQSLGHNISNGPCVALNHPTDRENYAGDLGLGALGFNGGDFIMNTILPEAGSPLIDAADAALCPALDQRGAARVGACDIGAVEYDPNAIRTLFLPAIAR